MAWGWTLRRFFGGRSKEDEAKRAFRAEFEKFLLDQRHGADSQLLLEYDSHDRITGFTVAPSELVDKTLETVGTACWYEHVEHPGFGPRNVMHTKGYLVRRGLAGRVRLVKVKRGVYHISPYGNLTLDDLGWFDMIGAGRQIDALDTCFADPGVWTMGAQAAASLNSGFNASFACFTEPAVHSAISAIPWVDLSLPEALATGLSSLLAYGTTVAHVLASAAGPALHGVPFIMTALRLYAYYTQVLDAPHNSARVWDRSKKTFRWPPVPPSDVVAQVALRAYNDFVSLGTRTAIDPCVFSARNALKGFTDTDAGQRAILGIATNQAVEIATGVKEPLRLTTDVSEVAAGLLARRFPEFSVSMVSRRHTHGVSAAVRHAFMMIAHNQISTNSPGAPVRLIGAVPGQTARFGNVVHNCAPILSGRDEFRHSHRARAGDIAHHNLVSVNHKFQDCHVGTPGAILIAPFSGNDISFADFARKMISIGTRKAFVMVNLPVPMLDLRVTTYRDDWLGFLYERHGKELHMYHTQGASAGYVNDFDATMSWCRPAPRFEGFHVQAEELRRFGTSFMLEVTVGFGNQELIPTMWRVTDEQFYTLPLVIPTWREPEPRFFVVPKRRFENIVEFASAPGTKKELYDVLATKVRGQQAEIKIGGQVIEPRWELDADEFNAIILHAMLAVDLRQKDFSWTMPRYQRYYVREYSRRGHFGPIAQWARYFIDLFTGQLTGDHGWNSRSLLQVVCDWFCARKLDRTQILDFYVATGEYRVLNRETTDGLPSIIADWCDLKNFARAYTRSAFDGCCNFASHIKRKLRMLTVKDSDYLYEGINFEDFEVIPDSDTGGFGADLGHVGSVSSGPEQESRPESPEPERMFDEESRANSMELEHSDTESEDLRPDQQVAEFDDSVRNQSPISTLLTDGICLDFTPTDERCWGPFEPGGPLCKTAGGSKSDEAFFDVFDGNLERFLDNRKEFFAPDSGLLLILEAILRRKSGLLSRRTDILDTFSRLAQSTGGDDSLTELIQDFYRLAYGDGDVNLVDPLFLLNGVAGSAKSSIIRALFKTARHHSITVVTPSRKLAQGWKKESDRHLVITQHQAKTFLKSGSRVLVIDECFSLDFNTFIGWLALAGRAGASVLLLGEENQRYEPGLTTPLSFYRDECTSFEIRMPVSNTMPMDVVACARKLCADSPLMRMAQTRSDIETSIILKSVRDWPRGQEHYDGEERLVFTARLTDLKPNIGYNYDNAPSVSQVQGSRTQISIVPLAEKSSTYTWLQNNPNQLYVLISRHSRCLLLGVDREAIATFFPFPIKDYICVNGIREDRFEKPNTLDVLHVGFETELKTEAAALRLRDSVAFSERLIRTTKIDDAWTPEPPTIMKVDYGQIRRFIAEHSQHDSIMDHEHALDMKFQSVGSLHSLGRFFEIRKGEVTRSPIEGATKLAVHQQSTNTYDDLRNVVLRQTSVTPKILPIGQILNEAEIVLKCLRRNYMKEDFVTYQLLPDPSDWINSRSASYLASFLSCDTCHLEDGGTTRHRCFLKTQDKVKPEPGFSASWTHGQAVISSDVSYNAWAGPSARHFAARLSERMRDDVIIDVGYSDRELGRLLRERGICAKLNDENFQVDISRQDSSHSAVSIMVFCSLLVECGFPEEDALIYAMRRSQYSFRSLSPGLYKGVLRYNLPSGDPFTLICNVVQEMSTTAERYQLEGRASIHKGDDATFSGGQPLLRRGTPVMSMRDVTLKEATGLPPYHAGRFILRDDLCIDPVRRFLKHFARLDNPRITNREYYVAILDWNFKPSEETRRYLSVAAAEIYTDYTRDEIDMMIQTCAMLRDREFFNMTYPKNDVVEELRLIEFREACAFNLALVLFPNRDAKFYAQFMERTQNEVVSIFRRYFQGKVYKIGGDIDRRKLGRGVYVQPDHVFCYL